jgi:hypothetical protein
MSPEEIGSYGVPSDRPDAVSEDAVDDAYYQNNHGQHDSYTGAAHSANRALAERRPVRDEQNQRSGDSEEPNWDEDVNHVGIIGRLRSTGSRVRNQHAAAPERALMYPEPSRAVLARLVSSSANVP